MANGSESIINITGLEVITGQKTQDFAELMETQRKLNEQTECDPRPITAINSKPIKSLTKKQKR